MSFATDILKFTNAAVKDITQVIEESFSETADMIIDDTPVDTGKAQANWNASINSPNTTVTDSTSKSNPELNIKIGETAYLTNSVPYISVLESGSSKVQGHNMVKKAVVRWQNTVDKKVRKIK